MPICGGWRPPTYKQNAARLKALHGPGRRGCSSVDPHDATDEEAEETIWDERSSIRGEIEAMLKGREDDSPSQKPLFTAAEVVTMAVLCSDEASLAIEKVMRWRIENFSYYAKHSEPSPSLRNELLVSCDDWEAPFVGSPNTLEARFATSVASGRIFLRKWLEPERQGVFDFLGLPPEVRNHVYELVFSMPQSGIRVNGTEHRGRSLHLFDRQIDSASPPQPDLYEPVLDSRPVQEVMALLSVNKQVFKEAMPYFYNLNNFCFTSLQNMRTFAHGVGMDRFQHVGGVVCVDDVEEMVNPGDADGDVAKSTVQCFEHLKGPRMIHLLILGDNESWKPLAIRKNRMRRGTMHKGKISKIDFLHQSRTLKAIAAAGAAAQNFSVDGWAEQVIGYLSEAVKELKAGGQLEEANTDEAEGHVANKTGVLRTRVKMVHKAPQTRAVGKREAASAGIVGEHTTKRRKTSGI